MRFVKLFITLAVLLAVFVTGMYFSFQIKPIVGKLPSMLVFGACMIASIGTSQWGYHRFLKIRRENRGVSQSRHHKSP